MGAAEGAKAGSHTQHLCSLLGKEFILPIVFQVIQLGRKMDGDFAV